jgi:trimethylamine--corrinoid protein Co-methyltransferase
MSEERQGRRSGGRAGRAATRAASAAPVPAYLQRQIKPYELITDEQLKLIEYNADTILEQVGIEFRDYPTALERWKEAGAEVDGIRVRFPRGLCRKIVQD